MYFYFNCFATIVNEKHNADYFPDEMYCFHLVFTSENIVYIYLIQLIS